MIERNPLGPRLFGNRIVNPLKIKQPCTRPVFAIDPAGHVLTEYPNGVATFDEYNRNLLYLPPHIVVSYSPETWLWKLHEHWREHETWSWRVAVTNNKGRKLQTKRVAYYGFRDPQRKRNRYSLVIDASTFFRSHDSTPEDLLRLGVAVRSFCNANGIEVRASAAGIAGQLLRHPMFYPFARRRVPRFINESVRPHLPGGHYEAFPDPHQRMVAAMYIDQESAHHYAAESTPLPNANSVRAIGYTWDDMEEPYAYKGGILYDKELAKHGLIKAKVHVPHLHPESAKFAPPLMRKPGEHIAYIWTNELPYMEQMGLDIEYLIGLWGTDEVDKGIAKFAQWARTMTKQHPQMKALLLMPYGLLARRSDVVTFHHPGDGEDPLLLAGQLLEDTRSHTTRTHANTANALQLGLIQSFVRSLSLDMARQVTRHGHEVASIYSDGVFVRLTKGKSLPLFAPWRVKGDALVEITESHKVPVRLNLKRDYQHVHVKDVATHGR